MSFFKHKSSKSTSSSKQASVSNPKTTIVKTACPPDTVISPQWNYTEEQKGKIQQLEEYTRTILLPSSHPYHPWEARFLAKPDTHPRYMRAAKWNFADAQKRIKSTMEWRRAFRPELIKPEDVRVESETGKIILNGFDKDGRPILYLRPGRENTETSPRQVRHLVWWLERAKDLMPPGQESILILVDYKSCTLRTNPSLSVALKVLTILQQHYVETLGRALIVNLPFILNFFYKGISPFLDPVTRDKMRFNPPDIFELISKEQLDSQFGGSYDFEFEKDSYWEQIVKACHIAPDGTRTNEDLALPTDTPALADTTSIDALLAGTPTPTTPTTEKEKEPSLCSDSGDSSLDSGSEGNGPHTPKTPRSLKNAEGAKGVEHVEVRPVEESEGVKA